jgi:hypothetical protein
MDRMKGEKGGKEPERKERHGGGACEWRDVGKREMGRREEFEREWAGS